MSYYKRVKWFNWFASNKAFTMKQNFNKELQGVFQNSNVTFDGSGEINVSGIYYIQVDLPIGDMVIGNEYEVVFNLYRQHSPVELVLEIGSTTEKMNTISETQLSDYVYKFKLVSGVHFLKLYINKPASNYRFFLNSVTMRSV